VVPHLRARDVIPDRGRGSVSSPLALVQSDIVLDASVEREGCPARRRPDGQCDRAQALGDALAEAIVRGARLHERTTTARLHPAGALGVRLSLTVGDVMRRGHEPASSYSAASLKDAVIEITRTGYGAVCVLADGGRLAGFLTDGDIRRSAARGWTTLPPWRWPI